MVVFLLCEETFVQSLMHFTFPSSPPLRRWRAGRSKCRTLSISWLCCQFDSTLEESLNKLSTAVSVVDERCSAVRVGAEESLNKLSTVVSVVDDRCSAVRDDVRNVSDELREAHRALDAKLTKEVVARRSMREHFIGSLRDDGSSRVDLEQRVDELASSFQYVAERVSDTRLDSRFGHS